jgi:hypothetical protein
MPIKLEIHRVGQGRQVQNPARLLEASEGRYLDRSETLTDNEKYPAPNNAIALSPFVVRGRIGG